MEYKIEGESEIVRMISQYDAMALTLLVQLRGEQSHLKFVFPEEDEEVCVSLFSVLAKLSHDANVPALFLMKLNRCLLFGVLYADQLLIISSHGERRTIQLYEQFFKKIFSDRVSRPLKKLFISCSESFPGMDKWAGAICVEMIDIFECMYQQLPENLQSWIASSKGSAKNDYWGFSYYSLPFEVIFGKYTYLYHFRLGEPVDAVMLEVLFESHQKSVLKLLGQRGVSDTKLSNIDYLKSYYRAFWQVVIHRLLIDQLHFEVSADKSNERRFFYPAYNPAPISDIAYTELLKLIREMAKSGSAEIDRLQAELLQINAVDYSHYDPNQFSSDEDDWTDDEEKEQLHIQRSKQSSASDTLPKKLSAELALSYAFIGQRGWSDSVNRRGTRGRRFLGGLYPTDCLLDTEKRTFSGQSKLFFLSKEEAQKVEQMGGKLSLKHSFECIEYVKPYSQKLEFLHTNFKSPDSEIVSLLFSNRGSREQLKKFISSEVGDEIVRELKLLNQTSLEAQQPVIFLIGHRGGFICGALYNYKILWISPFGERDIEAKESLLKGVLSDSQALSRWSLFVVPEKMITYGYEKEPYQDYSGLVCLELLALLDYDIGSFVHRLDSWGRDSTKTTRVFMGLPYKIVGVAEAFIFHPLIENIGKGALQWSDICELRDTQLSWLPVLVYVNSKNDLKLNFNRANMTSTVSVAPQQNRGSLLSLINREKIKRRRDVIVVPSEPEIFKLIDNGALDKIINYLGSSPDALTVHNGRGETLLHRAVAQSNPTQIRLEIVKVLLKRGADLDALTEEGDTPLHVIAKTNNAVGILELLLSSCLAKYFPGDKRAVIEQLCSASSDDLNLSYKEFLDFLNRRNFQGCSPLDYAISEGNFEVAECLLIHRATLFNKINLNTQNALRYCFTSAASPQILKKALSLCLAYSSREEVSSVLNSLVDGDGNTLLHECCIYKNFEYLQIFLGLGVNNVANNQGTLPIQCLPDESELSLTMKAYLTKSLSGRMTKPDNALLSPYDPKNKQKYLARVQGVFIMSKPIGFGPKDFIDPNAVEESAGLPNPDVISSPAQFFVQQTTRLDGKPLDLPAIEVKMKAFLNERALMVSNLLNAARSLEKIDEPAYSKHRCAKLLAKYQWFLAMSQNSVQIYNLFSCPMPQLDKHLACCHLTLQQYKPLLDKNRIICERITRQKLLLESKGKITDASLKSTFPAHDINTLKKIFKNKELLSSFSTGVTELMINHINIEQAYQAIIKFFTELQEIITLIKMIQLVFKLRLASNPAPADRIFCELRDELMAVIQAQHPDDNSSQKSSQINETSLRW